MSEHGPPTGEASDAALKHAFPVVMHGHEDVVIEVAAKLHDPALGDGASVNRGEHRQEVVREIAAWLRAHRWPDGSLHRVAFDIEQEFGGPA